MGLKELTGFAISSKRRFQVFQLLSNSPMRPFQIARKLSMHHSEVSRALFKLEKKQLVKCITPEKKSWRVYMITETGKEVLDKIETL